MSLCPQRPWPISGQIACDGCEPLQAVGGNQLAGIRLPIFLAPRGPNSNSTRLDLIFRLFCR